MHLQMLATPFRSPVMCGRPTRKIVSYPAAAASSSWRATAGDGVVAAEAGDAIGPGEPQNHTIALDSDIRARDSAA